MQIVTLPFKTVNELNNLRNKRYGDADLNKIAAKVTTRWRF